MPHSLLTRRDLTQAVAELRRSLRWLIGGLLLVQALLIVALVKLL